MVIDDAAQHARFAGTAHAFPAAEVALYACREQHVEQLRAGRHVERPGAAHEFHLVRSGRNGCRRSVARREAFDVVMGVAERGAGLFERVEHRARATAIEVRIGRTAGQQRSRYPEGDHVIFVGEVEQCAFA